MVAVFREVKRVLREDGTLWLNLGDSYAATTKGSSGVGKNATNKGTLLADRSWQVPPGLKPKDLIGIPWRVAFALQADGWYLRQDIIWHKPNPMPESVTDRCTKAHEYIFLLSKSERYYYDHEAIKEDAVKPPQRMQASAEAIKSKSSGPMARGREGFNHQFADPERLWGSDGKRNKRSVWTVATEPCKEAHFATFPQALITPCILAGCPVGGTVLDPFGGSCTTGQVSESCGRNSILIELNPAYIEIGKRRTAEQGLGI
jgi:DNA modification methylase